MAVATAKVSTAKVATAKVAKVAISPAKVAIVADQVVEAGRQLGLRRQVGRVGGVGTGLEKIYLSRLEYWDFDDENMFLESERINIYRFLMLMCTNVSIL